MDTIVIEDGGFKLTQVELGSPFWDLEVRKKVKHKDGTESIEWKNMAYGVSIEHALNTIILCRIKMRNPEVMDFKKFFDAYKFERLEVMKSFNLTTINLTKDLVKLKKELSNEEDKES